MKSVTLRVLVVDDNEIVRRIICEILKSQADIDIVCEASNGRDAVRLANELKPDLVLLDITMPGMNGLEAARLIKHELPDTHILIVSQFASPAFIQEAFASGASGYVIKDKASIELIPAVRRISSSPTVTLPISSDAILGAG